MRRTRARTPIFHGRNFYMLVLSRRKTETIRVGDDITITILKVRGDKIKVGIVAPPEVIVHREEVFQAIKGDEQNEN